MLNITDIIMMVVAYIQATLRYAGFTYPEIIKIQEECSEQIEEGKTLLQVAEFLKEQGKMLQKYEYVTEDYRKGAALILSGEYIEKIKKADEESLEKEWLSYLSTLRDFDMKLFAFTRK